MIGRQNQPTPMIQIENPTPGFKGWIGMVWYIGLSCFVQKWGMPQNCDFNIYIYNMVMYNYEPHLNHWILGTLFSGKISMFWL